MNLFRIPFLFLVCAALMLAAQPNAQSQSTDQNTLTQEQSVAPSVASQSDWKNADGSRTQPIGVSQPPHITSGPDNPVAFVDDFDGTNDTTALKARGYKVYYRGSGPQGLTAVWYQGSTAVFNAYNGPPTGYVAANYNAVTGTNLIDSWLVLPPLSVGANDSIIFFERSPTANPFPDSIKVMYSAVGDSLPEAGSWVQVAYFRTTETGSWGRRAFRAPSAGANARWAIRYYVVNGGPTGTNSNYIGIDALTVTSSGPPPVTYDVPEVLYFKFNAGTTTTPNYAVPGRGNATATVTGHTLAPGGQFDSTLLGGEGAGSDHWVDNGWAPNLGNGSWTIGFWLSGLHLPTTITNPCYLFGDVNTAAFRCFWAGAGISTVDTAILFRKTGLADLRIVLPNPSLNQNSYVHIVYDSTTSTIAGYRNGVRLVTGTWASPSVTGAGPFKIAGYSTAANSLVSGAKMDEFRLYSRALDSTEIAQTWNHTLPYTVTGVSELIATIPEGFELSQNYPNPFNPTTTIKFALPQREYVTLRIYNTLGQEVATLHEGELQAGTFETTWDAKGLASGMYFYRLQAGSFASTKKLLLLK
jgi:hypothetical protein